MDSWLLFLSGGGPLPNCPETQRLVSRPIVRFKFKGPIAALYFDKVQNAIDLDIL